MIFSGDGASFVFWSLATTFVPFLLVLLVVVFLWRRDEPDTRGMRAFSTYVYSVIFVCVIAALIAVGVAAANIGDRATDADACGGVRYGTSGVVAQSFPTPARPPRPPRPPVPSFPTLRPVPAPTVEFPTLAPRRIPPFNEAPSDGSTRPLTRCDGGGHPLGAMINALIITAVAGGVLRFHVRHARRAIAEEAM